jgi:hypothetical protein
MPESGKTPPEQHGKNEPGKTLQELMQELLHQAEALRISRQQLQDRINEMNEIDKAFVRIRDGQQPGTPHETKEMNSKLNHLAHDGRIRD